MKTVDARGDCVANDAARHLIDRRCQRVYHADSR
ncbi:hypothetical protein AZ54_00335 [Xanthomonas oryzae pv. oryzae PXO86]|nr:hypothetical protein AZ54_00335 [Xanthomonas oryzae pv. oryzae PXO86]